MHSYCGCKGVGFVVRGQITGFLRKFTTKTKYTHKWKQSMHIYSYSFNWGGVNELTHLLARDTILNQDGLVVINKPYGIGKDPPIVKERKLQIEKKLNNALGEKDFYLNELLPLLARKLDYPYLETIKIPERYTSGITILSASKELTDHVQNCIKKGKAGEILQDTYRLVCVGNPLPLSYKGKVAIIHEEDKISGGVQPILLRTWSKSAVKRGDIRTVSVEHNTLHQGRFASLVDVKPSRTKSHFLRFYMAYMLSPILGDNLYGSRVQKIGSSHVAISPFSDRAKMPQRLEDSLLSALNLERKDEIFIPTHIHLHKVTIPNFSGKGKPLDIVAPLPEVFKWTCEQLIMRGTLEEQRTVMEG